jgi:hypothetical protein
LHHKEDKKNTRKSCPPEGEEKSQLMNKCNALYEVVGEVQRENIIYPGYFLLKALNYF